jgi:hypothetical protein
MDFKTLDLVVLETPYSLFITLETVLIETSE